MAFRNTFDIEIYIVFTTLRHAFCITVLNQISRLTVTELLCFCTARFLVPHLPCITSMLALARYSLICAPEERLCGNNKTKPQISVTSVPIPSLAYRYLSDFASVDLENADFPLFPNKIEVSKYIWKRPLRLTDISARTYPHSRDRPMAWRQWGGDKHHAVAVPGTAEVNKHSDGSTACSGAALPGLLVRWR